MSEFNLPETVMLVLASTVLAVILVGAGRLFYKPAPDKKIPVKKRRECIDYRVYVMSRGEKVFYTLQAAGFLVSLSYIFYHSVLVSLTICPLALVYPRLKSRQLCKRRQDILSLQFRDALYALASSVSAGKSVETAFKDAAQDLHLLYPEKDAYILQEFTTIILRLEMNTTVEEALRDFAARSGLEDIRSFAEVFATGKRSGGNMVDIIINTSNVIGEKLRIKEEINTLLAQRKLEQKVLNCMPVLLIVFLTWSTGDYMAPVFETVFGRVMMTVAVALLAAAYYVSQKIIDIEV